MAGSFTKILDCRKEVRDYRLVPNPSRWKQKGERVMIQSPMLEILESTSHVPAKRYSYGQAQNYACFLLRDDIDYHYTGTRGWIDAHGVALFNSSSTDQLHFERGQRFWLNIKPETNASETTVPVINLDTFDEGTINIDKVCWYPKVQGPNHELWTLGGDIRKQKLVGSRKFIYWSWVICQRLDGSTPTTKMAEIPTREVECQGKRLLSSSEAKSLFEQRYRNMEKPTAPADVLSPPLTPLQCSECIQKRSRAPDEDQQTPTRYKESRDLWRRIFSMAKKNGGSYKCLQRSNIHPQKLTPPPLPLPPRNNNGQVAMVESSTIDEDDSNPAPLPIENSPSTTPQPPSSEHKIPEPEDDSANRAAQHLVQMSHSQVPSSLEILEISDDLCDLYGLKCKYTPISTNKHFHSPPSKCVLHTSPTDPSLPPHEHCVSHLSTLPDRAGRCLLLDKSPSHICCHWNPEDRENEVWSAALDEREKQKETDVGTKGSLSGRYRYGDGVVEDRSEFIKFGVGEKNFYMGEHIRELGEAGRDVLEGSLTESEIRELGKLGRDLTELEKDTVCILINGMR